MTLFDDFLPPAPPVTAPRSLELCFGIGGMGIGIERAGFRQDLALGIELNEAAYETAKANGHSHVIWEDITRVSYRQHEGLTLLAGGVPCQPFSHMAHGLRDLDPRDCWPTAVRAIAEARPDVAIFENVKGMAFEKNRAYLTVIVDAISDLGYDVEWRVINCADYGTPQNRLRFVLIAVKRGMPLVWAEPVYGTPKQVAAGERLIPHRTIAQAWGWPDDDPRRYENEGVRERIQRETRRPMEKGVKQSWSAILLPHEPYMWERPATTLLGRLLLTAPGTNANAVNGSLKGQNDGTPITPWQMARLQGLPADWTYVGNQGQVAKQLGNVFPPQPAEALARAATRHLLGDLAHTPPEGITV